MFEPEPESDQTEETPSADVPAGAPETPPADVPESAETEAPDVVLPPPPEEPPAPLYEDVPLPVEVPKWAPQDVFAGPSETPAAAPEPAEPVSEAVEPAAEPLAESVTPADAKPDVPPTLPAPLEEIPAVPAPEPSAPVPAVEVPAVEVPAIPDVPDVSAAATPETAPEVPAAADVPGIPAPVAEVPAASDVPPVPDVPVAPEPVDEVPAPVVLEAPVPEAPATEVPGPFPFTPAPAEVASAEPAPAPEAPAVPDVIAEPVPAVPPPVPEVVAETLPPVPPPPVPTAAAETLPPVPEVPPAPAAVAESSVPEPAEPALDPMFRPAAASAAPETGADGPVETAALGAPFGAVVPDAAPSAPAEPDSLADVSAGFEPEAFDEPETLAPVIPIDLDGKWVASGRGARSSGQRASKGSRGFALKRKKEENPFEVVGDAALEAEAVAETPDVPAEAPAPQGKRGFGREIRFGRKKKKDKEAPAAAVPAGWGQTPGTPQVVPAQPSGPDTVWGETPAQPSGNDAVWGAAPAAAAVWATPAAAAAAPAEAPAVPAGTPAAAPAAVPAPPVGDPAAAVPPPPPGSVAPQTLPAAPGFGGPADAPFPSPEFTPTPQKRGLKLPAIKLPAFITKRSSGDGGSRKLIAIIVVAALVVAGLGYMVLGRGGGASTPAFALDLAAGKSYTYDMTVAIDAHMYAGGRTLPVNETMRATMKWDVQSVDAAGNATVAVEMSNFSATVNGQSVPVGEIPAEATKYTMQIAPDGTILSGGSLGMLGGGTSTAGGLPGTDQLTPVLPGHDVAVGATWTKSYSQTLPYGMGTIHAKTHSVYLRNESVDGTSAAVVRSTTTVPLHMKINLRQMLQQLGSSAGSSFPSGSNPVMTYKGKVHGQTTGWYDTSAHELLRTSMTARFDMHIGITGVPGATSKGLNNFTIQGAMTLGLQKA